MNSSWTLLCRALCAAACLALVGCCSYPTTRKFGVADNFSLIPDDPVPYNPAFPPFVAFLNTNGISTANLATFDDQTPNRHMVATLRHGLRSCFAGATTLDLCFSARALSDQPQNDSVVIYNTDLANNTFQTIYSAAIAPTLIPTWNPEDASTLCIDLTSPMTGGQIGDMLQFMLQDDTSVDVITMTLQ